MPELFCQVADPRPAARGGRVSALPVSMAVHVALLCAVIVIPLLATDVLPAIRSAEVDWTPIALPSPPPLPVAAVRRAPVMPATDATSTPVEAPSGFTRERMLEVDSTPDVAAPDIGGSVPGSDLPPGFGTVVPDAPPPVRTVTPIRVSSLVRPPVRIRDVSPVYPETARLARVEGLVVIEAVIGPAGDVQDAKVLRSTPLLDEAALAAVRQWRYTPSLLNGVPVPVIMTVTVNFTLK